MQSLELLNPNLIKINMEALNRNEVLKKIAKLLVESGNVKESYVEALLEREKNYPTGLPTESVGVAIPHADTEHVIKPAIAIAVLKEPIEFKAMSNPNEEVKVKIVFMLAIKDPDEQIKLLQSLIEIFQDKELLLKIASAESAQDLITLIKKDSIN